MASLSILIEQARIESCPPTCTLPTTLKSIVCPGIAGVKNAVSSFGFIKRIKLSINGIRIDFNLMPVRISLETMLDILH